MPKLFFYYTFLVVNSLPINVADIALMGPSDCCPRGRCRSLVADLPSANLSQIAHPHLLHPNYCLHRVYMHCTVIIIASVFFSLNILDLKIIVCFLLYEYIFRANWEIPSVY